MSQTKPAQKDAAPGDETDAWMRRTDVQIELRWQMLDRRTEETLRLLRWLQQEELPRMRETWQRTAKQLMTDITAVERRVAQTERDDGMMRMLHLAIWRASLVVATAIILAGAVMGVTLASLVGW